MVMKRIATTLAMSALAALLLPGAASAHEEEFPAKRLIEQAIALLRTQPEQREVIEDKIHDATESRDQKGVDIGLVQEADEAFEAGRLHETQDLLEESIEAAPHRVVEEPNEAPGSPAPSPAPETSPVLHERELEGAEQRPEGGGLPILLGLAGVLVLAGLGVAWRMR
jgi:hypothetical protein